MTLVRSLKTDNLGKLNQAFDIKGKDKLVNGNNWQTIFYYLFFLFYENTKLLFIVDWNQIHPEHTA